MTEDGGKAPWGSLLSARDFAAITSVGFHPVGQVLGAAVAHLGYVSQGGRCSGQGSYTSRTDLASAQSGPFNLLLRKRSGIRQRVFARALEQCQELDGDGIVGLRLTIRPFPAGGTEFTVAGTAVRARTGLRPPVPFTSHLSPPEFARLLRAGWVPAGVVLGVALGARHDDQRTRDQTRRSAVGEVRGYSALVRDTRRDARRLLAGEITAQGADGFIAGELTLHPGERECPAQEGQHDHVAEAVILGTAIAAFTRAPGPAGPAPLTILHLNPAPARVTELRPDRAPEPEPEPDESDGLADRLASGWAARLAAGSTISGSDSANVPRKD